MDTTRILDEYRDAVKQAMAEPVDPEEGQYYAKLDAEKALGRPLTEEEKRTARL